MPQCLASLAGQAADLKVSLLDASGDERVRTLADRHEGLFAYRRHGPDKGQSDAIIEGWANAPGDILGWLNADDFLYPDALEKVARAFAARPSPDVVAGHSAICDVDGAMTGYHWAVSPPGEALREGCVISQPSCFFRRAACERAGGLDASLHYTMDWDLWLRLLDAGAAFEFLAEPLSVVYWGEGTKTIGLNRRRREELDRLIRSYTPRRKQFRARRGFAARAALDAIAEPRLKRFLEGMLRRKVPYVFGVGPNGALAGASRLCWFHWDRSPQGLLRVSIDGASSVEARTDPQAKIVDRTDKGLLVEFDEGLPAGRVATLDLSLPAGKKARLVRCAFA
jgi:hypothetical protein